MQYITKKYGTEALVVFDGYSDEPSTKDTAHIRRKMGTVGKTVKFASDKTLDMKKDMFLANSSNKQRLINMMSEKMNASGIKTCQALGDADVLIITTAVRWRNIHQAEKWGNNTDVHCNRKVLH